MALLHSPKIVTSGLIFYYDMGNTPKSWKGVATTNVHANQILYTYNNVPSDVTATIVDTGEYYLGAKIYRQTLTPITATGVGYLTAGGNPGIGVYTANGGGTANTYTGYSIYFKLGVPGHTSPIFTHYSNVAGYLSSANYNYFADGWYRGHVIWYDTVTRTDSKFWAINPASATLNVPIVVYWCAPFREDRNDSTFVSPFVNGARANTSNLLDVTNTNNVLTTTSLTYATDNTFSFNGSSNYINLSSNIQSGFTAATFEYWCKPTSLPGASNYYQLYIQENSVWAALYNVGGTIFFGIDLNNGSGWFDNSGGSATGARTTSSLTAGNFYHVCYTWNGNTVNVYLNGKLEGTASTLQAVNGRQNVTQLGVGTTSRNIGSRLSGAGNNWVGTIPQIRFYNRALTTSEVQQNFAAQRGRYGI